MAVTARRTGPIDPERSREATVRRYGFVERVVHWTVTLAFVYLLLSGFALAYPRMAWLFNVLGGGQTVRLWHAIVGVLLSVGLLAMIVLWVRDMLPEPEDRQWRRNVGTYARTGHVDVDVGRFNAGQKGYFWFAVLTGLGLLITGLPLWFPDAFVATGGAGAERAVWVLHWSRILHHALYLLALAGFIIHVYMSTVMLPGTLPSMTSGEVTRAWAAHHHPRWFRERDRDAEPVSSSSSDGGQAGDGST